MPIMTIEPMLSDYDVAMGERDTALEEVARLREENERLRALIDVAGRLLANPVYRQ